MRILFLHPNFPAQFRHVATAIAQDKRHQVVFGTTRQDGSLPGVYKALYEPTRTARPETHHYVHTLENAVLQGQAVYRMAQQLQARGFVPDVVYGHSGWGPTLFCKDIFPKAKLLCYFEWFYHAHGSDADFDPSDPLNADSEARIRMKNSPILTDLYSCDRGLSPTHWQRQQFPSEYHSKISVLHDGVDTQFFAPKPGAKLVLPRLNLDLSHVDELVTYVGRGMEPYRGFPQLIEAVALLQERRPNCHVVIVGDDRVAYGKQLPDGKTYKQVMLEKFPLDLSRVHFTGRLPYDEYLQVLQASSAHIYLTRPFVLSWSMMEAMATGCLVVASNTAPVTEMIQDGVNGLLVDFFSPVELVDRLEEALNHPDRMTALRAKARETILHHYDLATLLPQHIQWIQQDLETSQIPLWTGIPGKSTLPLVGNAAAALPTQPDTELPKQISDDSPLSTKGKAKPKKPSPLKEVIAIQTSNRDSTTKDHQEQPNTHASVAIANPELITQNSDKNPKLTHSQSTQFNHPALHASLVQIGDRTITANELVTLLHQYQLLPKLHRETVIDTAIAPYGCTPAEQEQCCEQFYTQQQLTTETERQTWRDQHHLTLDQTIHLATRPLRIAKFKQATWGHTLESYFLKRKAQLDQVVYSLIRVPDADTARELYFRLKAGEQSFGELAQQYSTGAESRTGGLLGPVALSQAHPKLAKVLRSSQPGELSLPIQIEDVWVIVQLEKQLPAQLDEATQQRLLDELFETWVQEQVTQTAAAHRASAAAQASA